MQFKEVGGKIQVIAYRGYDKEKKRAVTKMLGSLAKHTFRPSDGLIESLTVEEKTELQSFIAEKQQSDLIKARQYLIDSADSSIKRVADCLANESVNLDERQSDKIWSAISDLQVALRKRGFKKPKADQTEKIDDSRQAILNV